MEKSLRVILIEDKTDDEKLIVREIRQHGYEVIYERVETAAVLTGLLEPVDDTKKWDVVLCDYTLPAFCALDALQIIKEKKLDIPLIVVSGTITEETAVCSMRAGAADYVMKNNLSRLVPAIERELENSHIRNSERGMRNTLAYHMKNDKIIRDRINALLTINTAINSSLDLRVTLNVILDQAVTQLGMDAAAVLLIKPDSQTLEFAAGRGFKTNALQYTRLRVSEGNAGRAALERRVIHISNMTQTPGEFKHSPQFVSEKFVEYYGVPLIAKGQVKGVLEIFHRGTLNPTPEWMEFLEAIARLAAIAIDNATLFIELQHTNIQLGLAYDATIEGWSKALDMRDKETEGHAHKVAEITLQLAKMVGIKEQELMNIRRGSLLHDIGKMAIPDKILLKPGPLSNEEWNVMQKHPVYAHQLLSPIEYLRPSLEIPYCHHERWDGTGYPRKLKGEQIPLSARVFTVVDVWDALQSDRPYRKPWPLEKINEYIHSGSKTHFDPKIVEAFMEMQHEGSGMNMATKHF
jgi:response regulator RpfG family c-di-GMP phosphodiesterase